MLSSMRILYEEVLMVVWEDYNRKTRITSGSGLPNCKKGSQKKPGYLLLCQIESYFAGNERLEQTPICYINDCLINNFLGILLVHPESL